MIKRSWCCGAVQFEMLQAPCMMGTCYCSRCRKAGASAIVFVKRKDVKWHKGKERVALYKPERPYKYGRCFCRVCGTSLGEILSDDATFPIAANALDTNTGLKNQFHEFTSEKPTWYEICDDAPQSGVHPSS